MKILSERNNIINYLPPSINEFLMDLAQMYADFTYSDIMNHEYTKEDIKKLTNLRRTYINNADTLMDEDWEEYLNSKIIPQVKAIIGN